MKQFEHVTPRDLRRYSEDPKKVSAERAYALYGAKRWITGLGKITPAGIEVLKKLAAFGDAGLLSMSKLEDLASGGTDERFERLGLIADGALTKKGIDLLAFFEVPYAR